MKGLIIDTTIKRGYVAAFDGEREAVCLFDPAISTQSALIPACRDALSSLNLTPSDLDGIAAVVGPGSFTGIRIGVSFANAMAFALNLPRFSLTAFDLMRTISPCAPLYYLDAGHNSVYAAVPEGADLMRKNLDKDDLPEGAVNQADLISDLPKAALIASRKAFAFRDLSPCAPTAETSYLKPVYMRKSQAERLKDEKK